MSFKKPFLAKPVVLGAHARKQEARKRHRALRRMIAIGAGTTVAVFLAGMAVTNRDALPTYYPNCSWARVAGAAPINRGEPGYRSALDADNDGIACEPYSGRHYRRHRR